MAPLGVLGFTNAKRGHKKRPQQEAANRQQLGRLAGFVSSSLRRCSASILLHSTMYCSLVSRQRAIRLRACSQYLKKSKMDKLA